MTAVLPIFPTTAAPRSFSVHKRPTFASIVQTPPSGREVTGAQMIYPLWEFELTYEQLRDESQNSTVFTTVAGYMELQALSSLYMACNGQFGVFLFDDPDDDSRAGQIIGTADGIATRFVVYRTFGIGSYAFTEPVGWLNTILGVYFDTGGGPVLQPGSAYSVNGNALEFVAAPPAGAVISADFTFYFLCRFIEDSQSFEQFMQGRWTVGKLRFRSTPPDPPAPSPPPPPSCLGTFDWQSDYIHTNSLGTPTYPINALDKFGNLYVVLGPKTLVFNTSGSVIASMNCTDLADAIDAWHGSAIVDRGGGFSPNSGFVATPVLQGQYILAYMEARFSGSSFARWYVILNPSSSGNPTVLGALFNDNLTGPPYLNYYQFLGIANTQTADDPLLWRSSVGLGGGTWVISAVPSINAIIDGTYAGGWPGFGVLHVPNVIYNPIAVTNLSTQLFVVSSGSNQNVFSGFVLPATGGGTNVYFYMNRAYMDLCASGSSQRNPEVHAVIQPAYPLGAMVKIAMGVIDYVTIATYAAAHGGAANPTGTGPYTIDNSDWVDGSAIAQIPFINEYTYLSNGVVGGTDVYTMQPGQVLSKGAGKWWVVFYMPGIDDCAHNLANSEIYENVRIFEYDESTEIATQIVFTTCVNYTDSSMPSSVVGHHDFNQALSITGSGPYVLKVNGFVVNVALSRVYMTDFIGF